MTHRVQAALLSSCMLFACTDPTPSSVDGGSRVDEAAEAAPGASSGGGPSVSWTAADGANVAEGAADGAAAVDRAADGSTVAEGATDEVTAADGATSGQSEPAACVGARANPSPALPGTRDPDILARAAVVYGSCMADDGIDRNLSYIWVPQNSPARFWHRTGLQAECLASARCGCGALKACLSIDMAPIDGGSCAASCSGTVFSACFTEESSSMRFTIDCGSMGLRCDPLAVCSEVAASSCEPSTFVPSCGTAGRSQICRSKGLGNAVFYGPVCEQIGLSCANGQCVGTGATCIGGQPDPEGQVYIEGTACSGPEMQACVGGRQQTVDCSRIAPGFSCQSVSGKFFCGLASECVPGSIPPGAAGTPNRCEGSAVVLCNAGRIDRVDCKTLGFDGCEVDRSHGKYGCVMSSPNP